MQEQYDRFLSLNVQVVAVSVDGASNSKKMVDHTQVIFPVLADPSTQTSKDYGVYDLLEDGLAAPATFIIDSNGKIIWQHIGQDAGDRPTAIELLQVLGSPQA